MTQNKASQPGVSELFSASLVAIALVYLGGVFIMTALVMATSSPNDWAGLIGTMLFQAIIGALIAVFAAFLLIAPLGTAMGLAVLRMTPAGWWQGPLTGVLVALSLEALVLGIFNQNVIRPTLGNAMTMSLPIVLAFFAGGYVQRRMLRWPAKTEPSNA